MSRRVAVIVMVAVVSLSAYTAWGDTLTHDHASHSHETAYTPAAATSKAAHDHADHEHPSEPSADEPYVYPVFKGEREVVINVTEGSFDRRELTLRSGAQLNVRLVNKDTEQHDFTLSEAPLHLIAAPGESAVSGLFVGGKPGLAYTAFCTLHSDAMTLDVRIRK